MLMKRMLIVSMLMFSALGFAQRLPEWLPADTVVALGMVNYREASQQMGTFIAEFERLEIAASLAAIAGEDNMAALEDRLPAGVTWLDVLGSEAWLSVSVSSFNPFPVITLATVLAPNAQAALAPLLADAAQDSETLQEGNYTFYTRLLEDPDAPVQRIAYALADDVLLLSSNPDTLRSALRQAGGSSEAALADSEGYQGTLASLATGNFYGYLNYAAVAQGVRPFASGFGFDALLTRVTNLLQTLNATGGVARVTGNGLESEGILRLNPNGGDDSLYALLTAEGFADPNTATLAPAETIGFTTGYVTLPAWWDYLNELSRSVPELGGSLNDLALSFTGVNLEASLFAWMGSQLTSIVTGTGDVVQPGMVSDNLLGESVYVISTTDDAAAAAGLGQVMQSISMTVAMFADPSGGMGSAATDTTTLAGVSVTTYTMAPGVTISVAVDGGYAYIAPSLEALTDTLSGSTSLASNPTYQASTALVPGDASSLSYVDNSASLSAAGEQLVSQLQLLAGIGGASNLNFDAVQDASNNLQAFLDFTATRIGASVGYSQRSGDEIYNYSQAPINW